MKVRQALFVAVVAFLLAMLGASADADAQQPDLTSLSPAPASVLPCGDIDLSWASNADGHWVQVGSAPGASDYHIPYTTGADLGPVTSETLTNLPSDGSTIWVRIWTRTAAGWQTNPWFTYTACTADGCPVSATVLYDGESCYTLIAAPPGPERCPLPLLPEPTDPNLCRRPVELVPGG